MRTFVCSLHVTCVDLYKGPDIDRISSVLRFILSFQPKHTYMYVYIYK